MKLTPADVAAIRARRAAGEKVLSIALDFGVTPARVSQVCAGIVLAEPRAGARRSS